MGVLRIITPLQVICMIGHMTMAFPSIQQQVLPTAGSLSCSTTSCCSRRRQIMSPNDPRGESLNKYSTAMRVVSLRSGGDGGSMGKIKDVSVLGRYSQFVDDQPLLAKSLTAGIVTGLANLFSQMMVALLNPSTMNHIISWRRVVIYMLTGLGFIGPYLHVWYGYLDKVLAMPRQNQTTRTATKVVIDQIIGVCIFYPLYFTFMELLESMFFGRFPRILTTLEKCRADLLGIALMNWRVWPITNAINFGIIPQQFRVLVNQIVSFFWFAYLSTRT